MPTSTSLNKKQYNCGAGQTEFAFPYKCFGAADMVVVITSALGVETTLVLNTGYTVAPTNNDYKNGCVVTTIGADSPYAAGNKITLIRVLALTQSADFEPYGSLPANTLDACLDKLMMISQQLQETIGRQLLLQTSSAYSDLTMPDPVADKYLAWKADLTGLKNMAVEIVGALSVSDYIETLLDDADAGAVFDTLGISAFIQTLLNDDDAAEALKTLGNPVLTTIGDLLLRGAANPERLAAGAVGTWLHGKGAGVLPAYDQTPLTTKGDLIARGTSVPERLAAGADGIPLIGKGAGELPAYGQAKRGGVEDSIINNAKIDKSFTDGSETLENNGDTWVIPAGIYLFSGATGYHFDIQTAATWREGASFEEGGFVISDGTNMRFKSASVPAITIYYKKLD